MPQHALRLRTTLALAIALVACDDKSDASAGSPAATKYAPALSAELVPAALRGAVVGQSTDAEVTKAFGAGTMLTDKSLGGTGKVSYTDAPAMRLTIAPSDDIVRGEAWFVPDANKTPRLQHIEVVTRTADTCKWIETNVGAKEGSTKRPGSNRSFGARGEGNAYTAGTPDGSVAVGIECNPSQKDGVAVQTVVYSIESGSGRSMMAQEG
jgi:hypothetical protein